MLYLLTVCIFYNLGSYLRQINDAEGSGAATALACDVTDAESVEAIFQRIAKENDGNLDVLVRWLRQQLKPPLC